MDAILPVVITQKFLKSASKGFQLRVIFIPQHVSVVHLESRTFADELFQVFHATFGYLRFARASRTSKV